MARSDHVAWRRALVTGASSGIGEAFSDHLASAGVDLVLVDRNRAALEAVADRARTQGVDVVVTCADLSEEHDVANLVVAIRDAEPMIDLLVNNAGTGRAGAFVDLSPSEVDATMRVNNDALVRLTHAALPRMLQADRGCLVHISSAASRGPVSHHAVYAATKAFVTVFGQSLSEELAGTNVTCTTVLAGYTRTNFFERNAMSAPNIEESRWVSADQVAREALDAALEQRPLIVTGPSHRLLRQLAIRFPRIADSAAGTCSKRLRAFFAKRKKR